LLESTVTIPIDIFRFPSVNKKNDTAYSKDRLEEFQREIFLILEHVGYKIIPMERCPFEAVSKDRNMVLLTCVHKYNKKMVKKAQIVGSISKITEKHAVLFTDRETGKTNVEGTPIIRRKELKKIRDPEEIIELIIERI
ncbi:unnamed protein product, partial [marine sediment metagenome]